MDVVMSEPVNISQIMKERTDSILAPEGYLWICKNCGRWHEHRYGDKKYKGNKYWDDNCTFNAELWHKSNLVFNEEKTKVLSINDAEIS
jgi:hypothetical protein